MKKLIALLKFFLKLRNRLKIGFLTSFSDLSADEIAFLKSGKFDKNYVQLFENEIAKTYGKGKTVAFASGRMSFYSLLLAYGIGPGDEVAMTGFTCSVMANAVLRTGAKPIYVDIDRDTLGTSPKDLYKKINKNTKVVVAQHTFGLPCYIDRIKSICDERGILLIEDCALCLGSSYKGKKLGTWGVASIFSTDHSKPLNSLIGGGVYTENEELFIKLKRIQKSAGELSESHISAILELYLKEAGDLKRNGYVLMLRDVISLFTNKIFSRGRVCSDLNNDYHSDVNKPDTYAYPAKMPQQMAYLALLSLKTYNEKYSIRKSFMKDVLEIVNNAEYIPSILYNKDADIIPLRVPYILKYKQVGDYRFLNTDWIWFKKPIVATNEDLSNFYYQANSCPCSETVGKNIMNIPIYYEKEKQDIIIKKLKRIYKK